MGRAIVAGGASATKPLSGILASDLAVGSTVKLMENGSAVEYLVVNQGIPSASSLYDESCDGTWLLRKYSYKEDYYKTTGKNFYDTSDVHEDLNNTFFSCLGTVEQASIKQIKLPYDDNGTTVSNVQSGANGLETKVFLLCSEEVGLSGSAAIGARLSYFSSGTGTTAKNKRIVYSVDGINYPWWLRSPYTTSNNVTKVYYITITGTQDYSSATTMKVLRPALILPSTALFDKDTLILKGVA